ncbi:hypothetical protein [Arthrobacter sp. zg-Y179]|uniref:hypothetical protein n=1 Tax=Arthrobacter sp. zg-Y179 TaxID=2894188 RepID=UPI001E4389A8|nr:hypothetical protein [Arthrobacter sp. zg-Y179]MCC9172965.1 hypothetical protein [Arthrobacter sp. zg-Y179]
MDSLGLINLLHYGKTPNWWFTHSSGEAIQYLKTLTGEFDIPSNLRHLACETTADLPNDLSAPESLKSADIVVVEISTFKKLQMQGVRLNFQNVWGYAHRAGVSTSDVLAGRQVFWPAGIAPLMDLTADKSDVSEVTSDLLAIKDFVGVPMLTVDHIYSLTDSGGPIPGRPAITDLLAALKSSHDIPFHSTRALIEEYGQEVALADDNHYKKDFELLAGRAILASIHSALKHA